MRHTHIDTDNFRLDQAPYNAESAGEYRLINKATLQYMEFPRESMADTIFKHGFSCLPHLDEDFIMKEYWKQFVREAKQKVESL